MSAQNGDKARFNRLRKARLRRREKMLKATIGQQPQAQRQEKKAA